MTFLSYLAAQGDHNAQHLAEALSGLHDGANDLAAVIAHIRTTLGGSEAVLAEQEAVERWREWRDSERERWENFGKLCRGA